MSRKKYINAYETVYEYDEKGAKPENSNTGVNILR